MRAKSVRPGMTVRFRAVPEELISAVTVRVTSVDSGPGNGVSVEGRDPAGVRQAFFLHPELEVGRRVRKGGRR